jgi:hypothetical protein
VNYDDKKGANKFSSLDEETALLKKIEVLQTEIKRCISSIEELDKSEKEGSDRKE